MGCGKRRTTQVDSDTVRIVAGVLAVLVLILYIVRRNKRKKSMD